MGTRRTVVVAAVGLLLLFVGQGAFAQQPASPPPDTAKEEALEEVQLTRTLVNAERQALITRAMDLTPAEMQRFWPLYREYRGEMGKVGDRLVALIAAYADSYDSLTDASADTLLNEFVAIEKERARLRAKYLPRFKKAMPARKVARFYQLENKLDIAILAELADEIPLAR